ncbi:MAG: tRNA pseudouridine(38-40) synthase TruA [Ignavibacteriales bacterium]|nr:tRNA pseudouridine(38-40) synthase TruA [Ignavibacteriales bacterium]
MNNYKLKIQYDGTNYAGWQIQNYTPTVQQTIADAIKILLKEELQLIGAGRTDAGVHALGQVANFKTENEIDLYKFKHSLNSILPNDVSIVDITKVDENFHSRFSAKKRCYLYFISKHKSPFYEKFTYRYPEKLNIPDLNILANPLIGEHDFTSFCKKKSKTNNKECIVYDVHWKETKEVIIFFIEANRFLHRMVRSIVGTLLNVSKEKYGSDYIKNILEQKDRIIAGESVPAKGLFLYKVKY